MGHSKHQLDRDTSAAIDLEMKPCVANQGATEFRYLRPAPAVGFIELNA